VKIQRLFNDSEGESHFEEIEVEFTPVEFAPPAPPIELSEFRDAVRVAIMRAEPGWKGDWHPAPRRQLMFYLAGHVEGETSDGTRRTMGPGTVVLLEDTEGKGHRSWVVGDEEVVIAVVQLD
jgi:quercetin dioxygenase-like cupin family protein